MAGFGWKSLSQVLTPMTPWKLFSKTLKPRELWWFPMVLFSAGAIFCFFYTDVCEQHPLGLKLVSLSSGVVILTCEYALLLKYEKVQAYAVLQHEFSIPGRSTVNCVLYLSSAIISGLNETSMAGALFFYLVAAAVMSGERLLEAKTDLGLFLFLISCGVYQAYAAFGFSFCFWFFLAVAWVLLTLRGFIVALYAPSGKRDE